jgi:hypothetical protein
VLKFKNKFKMMQFAELMEIMVREQLDFLLLQASAKKSRLISERVSKVITTHFDSPVQSKTNTDNDDKSSSSECSEDLNQEETTDNQEPTATTEAGGDQPEE